MMVKKTPLYRTYKYARNRMAYYHIMNINKSYRKSIFPLYNTQILKQRISDLQNNFSEGKRTYYRSKKFKSRDIRLY